MMGICLSLTSCHFTSDKKTNPKITTGSLDLIHWDFRSDGIIALDGEWEFYWQQLLTPDDLYLADPPIKPNYARIPHTWNNLIIDKNKLSGLGYATYRATLNNINSAPRYALKLLTVSSAYTLWINGQAIAHNGNVGTNKHDMTPQYHPQIVAFHIHQPSIELILQVSNFHHRKGGVWNVLELGYEQQIRKKQRYRDYFDLFLLGSLVIMGLYHLGLYALRRKDPSTLYFGLFCLVIGIRSLFYHEMIISFLLPELNWEAVSRLRYILNFGALPLFIFFIQSLYPIETSKKIINIIIMTEFALILTVFATPPSLYTYTMPIHQLVTVLSGGYIIYILIKAVRNKHPSALWLLTGFFAFFIIIINDILIDHALINSLSLMPLGLLLFIFSQAFVLSIRFSSAFDRAELLTNAYERFVPNKFLDHLCKNDIITVELGDNIQCNMTILFADIRSFTRISETMTPQENFRFLNSYLERMEPIIMEHHGFIDKFIGDAIMALFEQNADDAVNAGIAMLIQLKKYNQDRAKSGYQPIHIGIGINTGELMLGIIGGRNRMDGTVISSAVNLAARMEELTKLYQTPLLISENTLHNLTHPHQHCIRMVDRIQVNGNRKSVSIYEVFDTDPYQQRIAKSTNQTLFDQATKLYLSGNCSAAQILFQRCLQTAPKDKVVHIYLQRIMKSLPRH